MQKSGLVFSLTGTPENMNKNNKTLHFQLKVEELLNGTMVSFIFPKSLEEGEFFFSCGGGVKLSGHQQRFFYDCHVTRDLLTQVNIKTK